MFLLSLLRTVRAVYITRIMNRKRKRVEDGEHDYDMGSTASQSSEELTSTEESDFEDDEETEHSSEFKRILKTLRKSSPTTECL